MQMHHLNLNKVQREPTLHLNQGMVISINLTDQIALFAQIKESAIFCSSSIHFPHDVAHP